MKAKYIFFRIIFASLFLPIVIGTNCFAQNAIGSGDMKTRNLEPGTQNFLRGNPSTSCLPAGTALRGAGMTFTQNKGQIVDMQQHPRPDILYKGSSGGADIYLRKTGISYVLNNMGQVMHEVDKQIEELKMTGIIHKSDEQEKKQELLQKQSYSLHRVDVDFVNANPDAKVIASEQIEGYTNYYYTHCPDGITHVNSYNEITVKNIYNNIDVKYYGGKENGMKYDIVVKPGADPSQIKLKYSGAKSVELLDGKLRIESSIGIMDEYMPKVYQNINGKIVDVATRYVLAPSPSERAGGEVFLNFELGTLNPLFPLVIDPWVNYYGGANIDEGAAITNDKFGNPIVVGYANSVNFPVTTGAFQAAKAGSFSRYDAFLVKVNPAGTLLFSTYYGGTESEYGRGIHTDTNSDIYITGETNSINLPVKSWGTAFMQVVNNGGQNDAFIAKFSTSGMLIWSTYYGGEGNDQSVDIRTDAFSNVLITGTTQSTTFPVQAAYQPAINNTGFFPMDIFVVKFDNTGVRQWSTYFGGGAYDQGCSIAVDPSGNCYVGGNSSSVNFPSISVVSTNGGSYDAVLFCLNPLGFPLWSRYLGGPGNESSTSVAIDGTGNVIIAFNTESLSGIATVGAYQFTFGGGTNDLALVKCTGGGTLTWATYVGGNRPEFTGGVAIDNKNNIYLYGEFEDTDGGTFAMSACAVQPNFGGVEDTFIAKYDPSGKQHCATYKGGAGHEDLESFTGMIRITRSISVFGNYIYTTGSLASFSATAWDAFIDETCINICESKITGLTFSADATNVCPNVPITFTPAVSIVCDTIGYRFNWNFAGGNPAASTLKNPTVSFPGIGTHDVTLVLTTLCKSETLTMPAYVTINSCITCNLAGQFVKGTSICQDCGCKEWIMINATGGTSPYTYTWPDGYDKRYKNRLCRGSYTISIKDKNGCTVNVNLTAP